MLDEQILVTEDAKFAVGPFTVMYLGLILVSLQRFLSVDINVIV